MTDDQLLKRIAQAARREIKQDGIDPAWERYATGELSHEQLRQLLAQHEPEEARQIEEAFRPLDDNFRADLLGKIESQLESSKQRNKNQGSAEQDADVAPPVELYSHRIRTFAPLAVAATLLLAIGGVFVNQLTPSFDAIPNYSATLLGGSEFRSQPTITQTAVYRGGDRVEIRLTPDTSIDSKTNGNLAHQVMAVQFDPAGAGKVQPLTQFDVTTAQSGATRMIGNIGKELLLTPGDYQLVVAIGREGAIPNAAVLQKHLVNDTQMLGEGWQAWRFDMVVESL